MMNWFKNKFPSPGWITSDEVAELRKALPDFEELVVHPRYGRGPDAIRGPLPEQVQFAQLEYESAWIFPGTRISADQSKQNYSVMPQKYYVDVLKQCCECRRWFIFFAKEQQYWFEELKFFRDSQCRRCPECRKHLRHQKNEVHRYSHLASLSEPTLDDVNEFLQLSLVLWNRSYLKRRVQLDRAISLAVSYSVAGQTLDSLRELRSQLK